MESEHWSTNLCEIPKLSKHNMFMVLTCYLIIDIDECRQNISGCNDTCVNTDGSFYCECRNLGYMVGPDELSCVGKIWLSCFKSLVEFPYVFYQSQSYASLLAELTNII